MKKLLILAFAAILSVNVTNGQTPQTKVYCMLLGTQKFFRKKVTMSEIEQVKQPLNDNITNYNKTTKK